MFVQERIQLKTNKLNLNSFLQMDKDYNEKLNKNLYLYIKFQ